MPNPKIIIAGQVIMAGDSSSRQYLPDPKSTLLPVGYQAGHDGTYLQEGIKSVDFDEDIPVQRW